MTLSSPYAFFGYTWSAHHIRVFGAGTYTINTVCTTTQLNAGICNPNTTASKNYTLSNSGHRTPCSAPTLCIPVQPATIVPRRCGI